MLKKVQQTLKPLHSCASVNQHYYCFYAAHLFVYYHLCLPLHFTRGVFFKIFSNSYMFSEVSQGFNKIFAISDQKTNNTSKTLGIYILYYLFHGSFMFKYIKKTIFNPLNLLQIIGNIIYILFDMILGIMAMGNISTQHLPDATDCV